MQMGVKDVRKHFIAELESEAFTVDKTGQNTIELLGSSFIADEPSIFGVPNDEYIAAELDWYLSGSTNINDIYCGPEYPADKQPPAAWQFAANEHGEINSNYGRLIFSDIYYRQYDNVLTELLENPDSRRASMVYQRPSIWAEYTENGKSDFICTNAVTYYIRNDELQCVVQMRSNDVVFGYKNDYAWQLYVLETLAKDLNVKPGYMVWQVQNLHVYERHFDLVK
jgi:thymidylate synthase